MIRGEIAYSNLFDTEMIWLNSKHQVIKIVIFDQRDCPIKTVRLLHNEEVKVPPGGHIEVIIQ